MIDANDWAPSSRALRAVQFTSAREVGLALALLIETTEPGAGMGQNPELMADVVRTARLSYGPPPCLANIIHKHTIAQLLRIAWPHQTPKARNVWYLVRVLAWTKAAAARRMQMDRGTIAQWLDRMDAELETTLHKEGYL